MFYLYCLSDDLASGVLDETVGIADSAPRLIEVDGIGAVVSEFNDSSIAITRENVLAHERVVARVLQETTPLPFRFGTLADAKRLESYIGSQKSSLLQSFDRVRGAVEMSVKIIWKKTEEAAEPEQQTTLPSPAIGETSAGKGTRFLLEKRSQIVGDDEAKMRSEELREWLEEYLKAVVRDVSIQIRPTESMVISASHLVARENTGAYRQLMEAARESKPDLHFLTSGPWAPYSFSNLPAH
jgi:hypothetical protein